MRQRRRAIALLIVLLAVPSLFWSATMPFFGPHEAGWPYLWLQELFFVLCLTAAAVAVWFRPRYWQLILLAAVGLQTYATAGSFIRDIVLDPSHWTYFGIVLHEASARGVDGGAGLVWALIVLPLALPLLLLTGIWLCLSTALHRRGGAI